MMEAEKSSKSGSHEFISTSLFITFLNLVTDQNDELQSEELRLFFIRHNNPGFVKVGESREDLLKKLFHSWISKSKNERTEYLSHFILRSLFVEKLKFNEVSIIFNMSESKVRRLAREALIDELRPESFFDRESRACARNDLYLLDVLTHNEWHDPLGVYTPKDFKEHCANCDRCKEILSLANDFKTTLEKSRVSHLPVDWLDQVIDVEERPLETWSRIPISKLVFRFAGLAMAMGLVFTGVTYLPNFGRFLDAQFKSEKTETQITENRVEITNPTPAEIAASHEEKPDAIANVEQDNLINKEEVKTVAKAEEVKVPPLPVKKPTSDVAKIDNPKTEVKPAKIEVAKKEVPKNETTKVFFRWGARAQDPDRISESVLKILADFKAHNAGELEFGSLHRGGRYFHFLITKNDYDKILNDMKALSLTDFTYVAAEGSRNIASNQARIVLWIGPTR